MEEGGGCPDKACDQQTDDTSSSPFDGTDSNGQLHARNWKDQPCLSIRVFVLFVYFYLKNFSR